jgi:hypothetical protein
MTEELVKRLRLWGDYALTSDRADLLTAADAIEAQAAEIERLREALRACRRAVSAGRDEPRRNVREIVDEVIEEHDRNRRERGRMT